MRSNSPTFNLLNGAATHFSPFQPGLGLAWHRVSAGVRSPVGSGVLGAMIILGMLLAFHQVVHGAVEKGALRLKAGAVHAEATRRCNALPGQAAINCLQQLNTRVALAS